MASPSKSMDFLRQKKVIGGSASADSGPDVPALTEEGGRRITVVAAAGGGNSTSGRVDEAGVVGRLVERESLKKTKTALERATRTTAKPRAGTGERISEPPAKKADPVSH